MTLGLGVLFRRGPELAAEQGSSQHGEADLDREHRKCNQGEQPAVDHHHQDVDHRESGVQNRCEGLTGEEVPDLLQLGHPGSQLTDRAAVEVAQRQPQQMVDHLGTEPLVDPIGCFGEQECLEAAQNPLKDRHHDQGDTEHLQGVEAALADHLVDDHLNQQGVGQGEQLHHKAGGQHLNQDAAITPQGGPEPGWTEFLIRCGVGTLHQQQLNPFRE